MLRFRIEGLTPNRVCQVAFSVFAILIFFAIKRHWLCVTSGGKEMAWPHRIQYICISQDQDATLWRCVKWRFIWHSIHGTHLNLYCIAPHDKKRKAKTHKRQSLRVKAYDYDMCMRFWVASRGVWWWHRSRNDTLWEMFEILRLTSLSNERNGWPVDVSLMLPTHAFIHIFPVPTIMHIVHTIFHLFLHYQQVKPAEKHIRILRKCSEIVFGRLVTR